MAKSFEELECWMKAIDLDAEVYNFVMNSKISKEYALKDQMLRSVGSIADNIAEGFERGGNKEFIQFLFIAKGSAGELRSQFHRCKMRNLLAEETFNKFNTDCKLVSSKISNLITYLKGSALKGEKFK
jgi:four helix bundle protein